MTVCLLNHLGRKSYTFKILRAESTAYLENLVLFEKSEDVYNAYIVEYDKEVQSIDFSNFSYESFKTKVRNHTRFFPLGEKTLADIQSRGILMCYVAEFLWVDIGTTCADPKQNHTFEDGSECIYWGHEGAATHDGGGGYWASSVSFVDCTAGSYGESSLPGGTTGPYQGGWSGNVGNIEILDDGPCKILKDHLDKAKEIMDNDTVKAKNNEMTATILTDTLEKGMYWGRNSSGKMMTSNIFNLSINYGGIPISNSLFTPVATAHNHNGTDMYTNFSSTDINGFHAAHQNFPTINHTFANGSDGSMYVMTIEDQLAFNDFVALYPMSTIDAPSLSNPYGTGDWIEGLDIRIEEDLLLDYFRKQGGITEDEVYDLTLGYLSKAYNMGIMISKKGTDGKFHPIQVEKVETTDPLTREKIITYQKINPCNL